MKNPSDKSEPIDVDLEVLDISIQLAERLKMDWEPDSDYLTSMKAERSLKLSQK